MGLKLLGPNGPTERGSTIYSSSVGTPGGSVTGNGTGTTLVTSLNAQLACGYYNGENLTGAPVVAPGQWWYVEVQTHVYGLVWQRQVAWDMNGGTTKCYTRHCDGLDPTNAANWSTWVELPSSLTGGTATQLSIEDFPGTGTIPAAPGSGATLWVNDEAARRMPAWVSPTGTSYVLQPSLAVQKVATLQATPGVAAPTVSGMVVATTVAPVAVTPTTASLMSSIARVRYSTAATINTNAGPRETVAHLHRSATGGKGGVTIVTHFGMATATTTRRLFVGLHTSITDLTVAIDTLTNCFGVGCNAGDTNLKVFTNDGAGTATVTDLGANFPTNTAGVDWYESKLFIPSGSTTFMGWSVRRLNTGDYAEGTVTTDMPAVDTMLAFHAEVRTTTAAVVSLDIGSVYLETDN